MSGKKSRSMIFSIAATYVSSSRTVLERFLGFCGVIVVEGLGLGFWMDLSEREGDGEESWRGECPGDNNMVRVSMGLREIG